MTLHGVHIYARKIRISFLILTALLSACSGLHLAQQLTVDTSDWPMFAKSETRNGATTEAITPPLTLVWDYDISAGVGNGSPVVIDSVLVVGNLRGELYAINAYSGRRIGWIDLGEAIQGSPTINGSTAIVALSNTDLSLVAFDLIEGKAQWKREYGDLESSPLLHMGRIFVGNTDGIFYAIDVATGERMWKFELPENTKHKGIRSSAAQHENMIVFCAEDGALYALDEDDGRQTWRYDTGGSIISSPCIADGNVYVGNLAGTIMAIDLHTGTLRWQFEAGSSVFASASFADNKIFVGTTGGTMYALDASTGMMKWKSDLGGVINSAAVIAGNTLYVGTLKKMLFGLNIADGSIMVNQEVQGRIKTSPAVAHGRLFVATDEKLILAFKSSTP